MADPPKKTKVINNWMNMPPQARPDITEQRRKLWEALSAFIHSKAATLSHHRVQKIYALRYHKIPHYLPDCLNSATRWSRW